jgi:hypothetical protein
MQTQLKVIYHDLPELSETFADSARFVGFDGQTFRFEFCVVRQDEPKPPAPQTGRQVPVCRLVLPPMGALDLLNKLKAVVDQLVAAGVINITEGPPQNIQKH